MVEGACRLQLEDVLIPYCGYLCFVRYFVCHPTPPLFLGPLVAAPDADVGVGADPVAHCCQLAHRTGGFFVCHEASFATIALIPLQVRPMRMSHRIGGTGHNNCRPQCASYHSSDKPFLPCCTPFQFVGFSPTPSHYHTIHPLSIPNPARGAGWPLTETKGGW